MRTPRPKSLLERTADSDLWLHTLTQIPSAWGRIVYLASLRSPITGKYEHHGLALVFGDDEADKAIRASHRKTFQEWLSSGLEEKVEDIRGYLDTSGEDANTVLQHWVRGEAWVQFAPSGILAPERSLYLSDMRAALRVLSAPSAGGAQGPGA